MGKTLRPAVLAHLEAEKLELLDILSTTMRIPRAVLIRQAVDDLIETHRAVLSQAKPKPTTARSIHRARLAKAAQPK